MQIALPPDVFVIRGARLVDYSGLPSLRQIAGMMATEFTDATDDPIFIVAARNEL